MHSFFVLNNRVAATQTLDTNWVFGLKYNLINCTTRRHTIATFGGTCYCLLSHVACVFDTYYRSLRCSAEFCAFLELLRSLVERARRDPFFSAFVTIRLNGGVVSPSPLEGVLQHWVSYNNPTTKVSFIFTLFCICSEKLKYIFGFTLSATANVFFQYRMPHVVLCTSYWYLHSQML